MLGFHTAQRIFPLIGVDSVPTKDIASGELWQGLFTQTRPQAFRFPKVPGICQNIFWIIHPLRTRHIISRGKPISRGSTKSGPAVILLRVVVWQRMFDELLTPRFAIAPPGIHKIAQW